MTMRERHGMGRLYSVEEIKIRIYKTYTSHICIMGVHHRSSTLLSHCPPPPTLYSRTMGVELCTTCYASILYSSLNFTANAQKHISQ